MLSVTPLPKDDGIYTKTHTCIPWFSKNAGIQVDQAFQDKLAPSGYCLMNQQNKSWADKSQHKQVQHETRAGHHKVDRPPYLAELKVKAKHQKMPKVRISYGQDIDTAT